MTPLDKYKSKHISIWKNVSLNIRKMHRQTTDGWMDRGMKKA